MGKGKGTKGKYRNEVCTGDHADDEDILGQCANGSPLQSCLPSGGGEFQQLLESAKQLVESTNAKDTSLSAKTDELVSLLEASQRNEARQKQHAGWTCW